MKKILLGLFLIFACFTINAYKVRIINNSNKLIRLEFYNSPSDDNTIFKEIYTCGPNRQSGFSKLGRIDKVAINHNGEVVHVEEGHGVGDVSYIITPDLKLEILRPWEKEL